MRVPLDPRLIADCTPQLLLPSQGPLLFMQLEAYVVGLENALMVCRGQLQELRRLEAERQRPTM